MKQPRFFNDLQIAFAIGLMSACIQSQAALGDALKQEGSSSIEEVIKQWRKIAVEIETSFYCLVDIQGEPKVKPELLRRWLNKAEIRNGTEEIGLQGQMRFFSTTQQVQQSAETEAFDLERPKIDETAPPAIRESQLKMQKQHDQVMDVMKKLAKRKGETLEETNKRLQKRLATTPRSAAAYSAASFDGNYFRRLDGKSGVIYPHDRELPRNQFEPLYLTCVDIYVPDRTAPDEIAKLQRASLLPDVLLNHSFAIAEVDLNGSSRTQLTGRSGVKDVMEMGERLWLDREHGLMVVRRELFDIPTSRVVLRIDNSEPQEVAPGVWLPMRCRMSEYAPSSAPKELLDAPLITFDLHVRKWSTKIPDGLFTLKFPPGTHVADLALASQRGLKDRKAVEYLMPADAASLDQTIEEAISRRPKVSWRPILLILNALAIALLIILILYKKGALNRWRRQSR